MESSFHTEMTRGLDTQQPFGRRRRLEALLLQKRPTSMRMSVRTRERRGLTQFNRAIVLTLNLPSVGNDQVDFAAEDQSAQSMRTLTDEELQPKLQSRPAYVDSGSVDVPPPYGM